MIPTGFRYETPAEPETFFVLDEKISCQGIVFMLKTMEDELKIGAFNLAQIMVLSPLEQFTGDSRIVILKPKMVLGRLFAVNRTKLC